jgi:cytochrome P450
MSEELYYDPFDIEIDRDPHPLWRRMRDEAPVYYNEKYNFYALTRFDDVDTAIVDWETYRSGRGSTLEVILANAELPSGIILMEDPPIHDIHRGLLTRVFTPRKMAALEPEIRAFCAESLDPLVSSGGFDFIADIGAFMPMRTIGMLLGIPEKDQEAIRDRFNEGLRIDDNMPAATQEDLLATGGEMFSEYIDWRAKHPSDDLMTEMLTAEFEDETGTTRCLTRDEALIYVLLLAGAGNETTTRLIGWTGKLLAEHPDQRRELVADRSLLPNAIEEILRYEAPSPAQARVTTREVEHHGQTLAEGSIVMLLNGSANRDDRHFADGDRFDIHRKMGQHLSFGHGIHFCLGAALARLEGRVALDEVLNRFPEWDVDWPQAVQAHTPTVRGWERMPVLTR